MLSPVNFLLSRLAPPSSINPATALKSPTVLFYGEEGKDYTKNPDGKINWEYPSNVNDLEELNFRCKRLNLFIDVTYEKKLAPFQEGAEAITDWFLNVAPNEGIERYDKNSMVLEAWDKYPDLKKETNLFNEYAIQIVLGKLPLDAFDEFVETYMERGGEEIINEATMQMKDGIATKYVK